MDTVEDVLAHFGVRGMHWGVRKAGRAPSGYSVTTSDGKRQQLHVGDKIITVDAARAAELKKRSKAHGVSALNNADLKFLNERIGLEVKYNQFFPKKKSVARKGAEMATEILINVGKSQATSFLNKQVGASLAKVDVVSTASTAATIGKHMKR